MGYLYPKSSREASRAALRKVEFRLLHRADDPLGRPAFAPPGNYERFAQAVHLVFCKHRERASASVERDFFPQHPISSAKIESLFLAHNRKKKELLEDILGAGENNCFVVPPSVAIVIGKQTLERGKVLAFNGSDESRLRAADLTLGLEPPPKREACKQSQQAKPHAEFPNNIHE